MIADLKPYPEYQDSGVPWLGEVPAHWQVRRFKYLLNERQDRSSNGTEQLLKVSQYTGVTERKGDQDLEIGSRAESLIGYKLVNPGDLVVNIMLAWNGSLGISSYSGLASPAYCVYRFRKGLQQWYFDYLLRSVDYKARIKTLSTGVIESRLRLYTDNLYRLEALVPPLEEQNAIVRFLDHAGRLTRRYIRAKQKLIKLLNEQKQAIIQQAVTRGLDPNVKFKPSGVAWLGDIPEHWKVVRSRRLFTVRKDLARPDDVQLSATQAYGVIPQAEFEQKVGRRVVKIFMHLEKRKHVEKDDFVISMRSFEGGLERAWSSGAIRSSYVVLKPEAGIDVSFFSYLLKSAGYISALQATANFIRDGQDLTYENFRCVDLPLVPIDEQKAIASYISNATSRIDANISRLSHEIELLREYQTRLIADVVTGKLDAHEAASHLPEATEEPEPIELEASTEEEDSPVEEQETVEEGDA